MPGSWQITANSNSEKSQLFSSTPHLSCPTSPLLSGCLTLGIRWGTILGFVGFGTFTHRPHTDTDAELLLVIEKGIVIGGSRSVSLCCVKSRETNHIVALLTIITAYHCFSCIGLLRSGAILHHTYTIPVSPVHIPTFRRRPRCTFVHFLSPLRRQTCPSTAYSEVISFQYSHISYTPLV